MLRRSRGLGFVERIAEPQRLESVAEAKTGIVFFDYLPRFMSRQVAQGAESAVEVCGEVWGESLTAEARRTQSF